MALKIKVRADQVVARENGNVKWISDTGELNDNTEAEISITDGGSPPTAPAPSPAEAPVKADKPQKTAKPKAPAKAATPAPAPKPAAATPVPAPAPPVSDKKSTTKAAAKAPSATSKEKIVAKAKKKSTAKGERTIGGKSVDLSSYNKTKSAAGGVSFNNGDGVAKKLEGKTLDEVYKIAAKELKTPEADLRAKYKKLNPGMQRMSLGNRLRGGPKEAKKAA